MNYVPRQSVGVLGDQHIELAATDYKRFTELRTRTHQTLKLQKGRKAIGLEVAKEEDFIAWNSCTRPHSIVEGKKHISEEKLIFRMSGSIIRIK